MKHKPVDVAVLGAGIVGAACAEAFAVAGLSVVVIEPDVIGGGATAAGMGGLEVMDDVENKVYPMPINGDQRDETFIGRIREDLTCPNGLAFWCGSDNLRKGAATNAVQIAELLQKQ